MTTISLIRDHDFNLANNYRNHDLAAFGWHQLGPQIGDINDSFIPPPHGPGFAILMSLPYALFDLTGSRYFLILLALATSFFVAALCDRLGFHLLVGTTAGFLLTTSPTWQMYASRILPECPVGLITVIALLLVHSTGNTSKPGKAQTFFTGVAIAQPPFIYLKYAPITLALLAYCLATKQLRRSIPFYAGVGCIAGIWFAVTWAVYGSSLTQGSGATNTPFLLSNFFNRLTANWFDKAHGILPYQPVFGLALWAIPSYLWLKKDNPNRWPLFSASLAITAYFTLYALFAGNPAESMPGRYACSVLPLMAVLAPVWVFTRRIKRPAEDGLCILATIGLAYTMACAFQDAPPWKVLDTYRSMFSNYWGPPSFMGLPGTTADLGAAFPIGLLALVVVVISKVSVILIHRYPVEGLLPASAATTAPAASVAQAAIRPVIPSWRSAVWQRTQIPDRRAAIVCLALVLIASCRVAATYTVFSHTFDEPGHIACGMEWLDKHIYTYDYQHPPLARVMSASGLYLSGIRSHNDFSRWLFSEGNAILRTGGHYDRNLAIARLGVLPLFWLACLVVFFWGKQSYSTTAGLIAMGLFSFTPAILAHAGLCTTDMALCGCLSFACFALFSWARSPSAWRAVAVGLGVGLAVLAKLSAVVFFPAVGLIGLVWEVCRHQFSRASVLRGIRSAAVMLAIALPIAGFVIWMGYRFSFGLVRWWNINLPAPGVFAGIEAVIAHQSAGHNTYLFGRQISTGWWLYYPAVLALKTPPALLALFGISVVICIRNWRQLERSVRLPVALIIGILVVGATSHINIGVRHILPVYAGMSIVTAIGLTCIYNTREVNKWLAWSVGGLLLIFAIESLASHPDYLAYTTPLIGGEPERVIAESDLDWGQDVKRLATRLRLLGINEVTFTPYLFGGVADVPGMPATKPSAPERPSPGWNAVSISEWKVARMGAGGSGVVAWPDRVTVKPVERIGKTILLWNFDAAQAGAAEAGPDSTPSVDERRSTPRSKQTGTVGH